MHRRATTSPATSSSRPTGSAGSTLRSATPTASGTSLDATLGFAGSTRATSDRAAAQTWVDKATGEIFNFKKGDVRPMEKVVRWVGYANAARQVATDEIANRIRMMRQGHFPTNPDPLGCALCPSQQWCHRFDMDTRR